MFEDEFQTVVKSYSYAFGTNFTLGDPYTFSTDSTVVADNALFC